MKQTQKKNNNTDYTDRTNVQKTLSVARMILNIFITVTIKVRLV